MQRLFTFSGLRRGGGHCRSRANSCGARDGIRQSTGDIQCRRGLFDVTSRRGRFGSRVRDVRRCCGRQCCHQPIIAGLESGAYWSRPRRVGPTHGYSRPGEVRRRQRLKCTDWRRARRPRGRGLRSVMNGAARAAPRGRAPCRERTHKTLTRPHKSDNVNDSDT